MSLAKILRQVAAPAATAIAVAFAANANAADYLEIEQVDLSKPIPSACFKDTNQGTAISKLKTAMGARAQKSVVAANQVVVGKSQYQEMMVTSNLQQGGEGYEISSNKPIGQVGTEYCWTRNQAVYVYSVYDSKGVPNEVNRGELGVALSNLDQSGKKVALTMLSDKGTIGAISFNPETRKGAMTSADGKGGSAAALAYLVDAGYSVSLPSHVKSALKIPGATVAEITAPIVVASAHEPR